MNSALFHQLLTFTTSVYLSVTVYIYLFLFYMYEYFTCMYVNVLCVRFV